MMERRLPFAVLLAVLAAALLVACRSNNGNGGDSNGAANTQAPAASTPLLGQRTKTSGCMVMGALPDPACSPGAVFPTATREQICVSGYAKSVRDVPQSEKQQVYAEYGIKSHKPGEYEVDHIVSLELGGSNEIANLYPEAAEPRPGFHEKDRYENYLHDQVCAGRIDLREAQRRIAENWLRYWQEAGSP
jgi:hypothetical protein